jgi:hypothetical protein
MPTSPPPPLSFRTLGFPQYGWKAGLSDGAFPERGPVKPAPGMPEPTAGLRPSFVRLAVKPGIPALCRAGDSIAHRLGGWGYPPPQGPSLSSRLCCPGASSLIGPIRPTRRHTAISPSRLIRDAFAVRERLGDLRVVPGFRGSFLPGMPPSTTPGSSDIARVQYSSRCRHGPSPKSERLGTPDSPAIRFTRDVRFRGFLFRICCGLPGCSPPLGGSDQVIPGHRGLIHPGFRRLGRPRRRWTSRRQPLDSSVGGTLTHWR